MGQVGQREAPLPSAFLCACAESERLGVHADQVFICDGRQHSPGGGTGNDARLSQSDWVRPTWKGLCRLSPGSLSRARQVSLKVCARSTIFRGWGALRGLVVGGTRACTLLQQEFAAPAWDCTQSSAWRCTRLETHKPGILTVRVYAQPLCAGFHLPAQSPYGRVPTRVGCGAHHRHADWAVDNHCVRVGSLVCRLHRYRSRQTLARCCHPVAPPARANGLAIRVSPERRRARAVCLRPGRVRVLLHGVCRTRHVRHVARRVSLQRVSVPCTRRAARTTCCYRLRSGRLAQAVVKRMSR